MSLNTHEVTRKNVGIRKTLGKLYDELCYSKDSKFDTTQVTLALATTKEGLPIGYRFFAENIAEVNTLMESINHWLKILTIRQIIIVGDRAMMSKDNIAQLQKAGLKYIIAYPMKKATTELKNRILDKINYTEVVIKN